MAKLPLLFLLLLTMGHPLAVESNEPSNSFAGCEQIVEEPHLDIALVDPSTRVRVWENLRLLVTVHSGGKDIYIDSLTLAIPESLGLGVAGSVKKGKSKDTIKIQPPELLKLGTWMGPVELEGPGLNEMAFWKEFGLLTYRASKETFVAVLQYRTWNNDQKSYGIVQQKTARLDLNASGHPLGMYAGAITGAFLVALFLTITSRRSRSSHSGSARSFGRNLLRGGVATAIAVLVLQTTTDNRFPISVSVEDFYGGVLLGLFGDQLAQNIQKRIGHRRGSQPAGDGMERESRTDGEGADEIPDS